MAALVQRFEHCLAHILQQHKTKGGKIQLHGGDGIRLQGGIAAENGDEEVRCQQNDRPDRKGVYQSHQGHGDGGAQHLAGAACAVIVADNGGRALGNGINRRFHHLAHAGNDRHDRDVHIAAGHRQHIVAADRHHAVGQLHDEARCAKADDIADAAPVGGQLTQGQRLHAVFRLAAQEIHHKRRRKQLRKHRGSRRAADAHAQHKDKHRVQHQVGRCADHHAEHTGCGIALRIDERVQPCCEHGRVGAQQVQHQVRQRILQCFRRSTE